MTTVEPEISADKESPIEPETYTFTITEEFEVVAPDIEHLVTEDDAPLDNIFSEKQQRLLTEPLYSSWTGPGEGRTFVVASNVGVFATPSEPALVPDTFLSVDVKLRQPLMEKRNRTYLIWEFGKPPDVVIEIVSNKKGGEFTRRLEGYARMRVAYYVIFDPFQHIQPDLLRCYELRGTIYVQGEKCWFASLGIGLCLWKGDFEGLHETWLRWCDQNGHVIPTGSERAMVAAESAEAERQRAEAERQRAEAEHQRAERLARRLRELGIEPEE